MNREDVENLDNWEVYEMIEMYGIATNGELSLVVDVAGLSEEVLDTVMYSRTGYRNFFDWFEDEIGFDVTEYEGY